MQNKIKSCGILFLLAANVAFLAAVVKVKMSVPYCREIVVQDIHDNKEFENRLDLLMRPDIIDELMKKK